MSDEQVTDLFERAVATVPPALLAPPLGAIRRRVRRRRATHGPLLPSSRATRDRATQPGRGTV